MKGKFIIAEGLDFAGKSATLDELTKLIGSDETFVFTREPGGLNNPIAESVRELVLNGENMDPLTEGYLFAASRAEHTKRIKSLLEDGKTVICDRFVYSSLYYQGILKNVGHKTIFNINKEALSGIKPDLILYFTVSEEEKKKRMAKRLEVNRLDKDTENINLLTANLNYLNMIHTYKPRTAKVEIIDTTNITAEQAAEKVLEMIINNI